MTEEKKVISKIKKFFTIKETELDEIDWQNYQCVFCEEDFDNDYIIDVRKKYGEMVDGYNFINICKNCMNEIIESKRYEEIKNDRRE